MDDLNFSNHSHKDLYDPKDPNLRRTLHSQVLRQMLAAKVHEMWCEWAVSMIDQGVITPEKVNSLMSVIVPFHNLPPDAQRDHLFRAERFINEFLNWKLVDQAIAKGGPKKGKMV
jgi:hypothetical protein